MTRADRLLEPPDTWRARQAPEWPFVAFVIGLFVLIALRSWLTQVL
jgi:hypothetical protein